MQPVTARFGQAIRTSHTVESYVDVTWPSGLTSRVDAITGQVTVDSSPGVRRTLTLDVPDSDMWSGLVLGGATLRPYRGVRYVDGSTEVVPLGVFDLRATSRDLSGLQPGNLTAPDRWRKVQQARFYTPTVSTLPTVAAQWGLLASDPITAPTTFRNLSGSTTPLAPVVWERDRGKAAEDLAASIGCEGYFNVFGDPTLRPVTSATALSVWTVDVGTRGVLIGGKRDSSDEQTYNAVIVTSTRTDGLFPFDPQLAEDRNPASPTYIYGPFGHVARFYSSPAITTAEQAVGAARALLRQVVGVASSLSLTSVVNPALDVGDVITVSTASTVSTHIIDALTVPLGPDGSMTIATRTQLPPVPGEV